MNDIASVDMSEPKDTIINISHKSSDREYARRNLEKYFVFSHTIERLIFQEEIKGLADCSLDSIVECIKACSSGRYKDEEWIGRWIAELKFMGLIEYVDGESIRFKLTNAGKESYRQQTFQSIYSDLLNARDSRRLSVVAICISVLALILSLFF